VVSSRSSWVRLSETVSSDSEVNRHVDVRANPCCGSDAVG
jgi:hypothetical protein